MSGRSGGEGEDRQRARARTFDSISRLKLALRSPSSILLYSNTGLLRSSGVSVALGKRKTKKRGINSVLSQHTTLPSTNSAPGRFPVCKCQNSDGGDLVNPAVGWRRGKNQREKSGRNDKEGNLVIGEAKCLFYTAAAPQLEPHAL